MDRPEVFCRRFAKGDKLCSPYSIVNLSELVKSILLEEAFVSFKCNPRFKGREIIPY